MKPTVNKEPYAPVSVIIPCYRCADVISRAIESLSGQSWLPKEVILIDDASDDNTLEALHKLQTEHKAGWIRVHSMSKNGGPGVARNMGWDLAAENYIAFLDSDDIWHPRK